MCPGTNLSALPGLASRTAGPKKSRLINIIMVPILSRVIDRKDHQNL